MTEAFRIRAMVEGRVIVDMPLGALFYTDAARGEIGLVDASKGVTVQIVESDSPVLERTYTERQLFPWRDADD